MKFDKDCVYDILELHPIDAVMLHRELWNWLSENPDSDKQSWPTWDMFIDWNYERSIKSLDEVEWCFACAAAGIDYNGEVHCERCLFDWPGKYNSCRFSVFGKKGESGLFYRWYTADRDEKKVLAKQIAELPIKKEVWGDLESK